MADRLTRIYTRTGDKGTTSLANGNTVSKSSERIETLGDIDELNSSIGVLIAHLEHSPFQNSLSLLQHELFDLGGELAMADPNYKAITQDQISRLECEIDQMNDALPTLKEFILPGGSKPVAFAHVARSICRRAERSWIRLSGVDDEVKESLGGQYLNRLSDYLFVLARSIAKESQTEEVFWRPVQSRIQE
jgi:cob(I)alamin adenosyltransferase